MTSRLIPTLSRRGAPARVPAPSETGQALVRVDEVALGYWTPRGFNLAVERASFEVPARERIVVIGPSGCGKSTLLKAIAGFIRPVRGTISVSGRTALAPGPDRAVVFQEFDQLFPWRSVLDNVAYPLRVNGRSRARAAETARAFLELTHLAHAADRYPHELSGGMKQRVAIARALALEPLVLLMDEPFGSLDAISRSRLQRELKGILDRTHTTLLFVTHSIDEALILGDRVVVLTGAPSTVEEIVDVRDVGPPDSPAYADMRIRLRGLLGVEDEEDDDRHA